MQCLRCGGQGHWAVNCPQNSSKGTSTSTSPNKRPAPSTTEGMVQHVKAEQAMILFQDQLGHDRPDATMLDPGASAFLAGYGPFKRYVEHLQSLDFPTETLEFVRCNRRFQFGGDAQSFSTWSVMLPIFVDGKYGRIQLYLLPGNTPMLLGRPLIEALQMSMDFFGKKVKFGGSPWQSALMGKHGEYLLSLTQDYENVDFKAELPCFDLRITEGQESLGGDPCTLAEFNEEEQVFVAREKMGNADGYKTFKKRNLLSTCETLLQNNLNAREADVTHELHAMAGQRVLWEVHAGHGRTSQLA